MGNIGLIGDSSSDMRVEVTPNPQPYPAYKPSGVEWLGNVPAHWEIRRLGSIAAVINGATPSTSVSEYWDGHILWVTPDDLGKLNNRYIADSARRITEEGYEACGTTMAPASSIALSTRAPIGHLGILQSEGCVNQGCRLLVPRSSIQTEYLHYTLINSRSSLVSLGQGSTFTELSRTLLSGFRIPLPPIHEQTAIAEYLDHVDERIRRYVSAKEKLIALLEKERQAVIHRTVTRGLDPNVRLKPSGVEWLGNVPAHWEIRRLGSIAAVINGATPSTSVSEYWDGHILWVTPDDLGKLNNRYIADSARRITEEGYEACGTTMAPASSIALSTRAPIGHLGILQSEGCVNQGCRLLVPRSSIQTEYLHYTLINSRSSLVSLGQGSTFTELSRTLLSGFRIPLPPIHEQTAIVEYLDKTTADIDAAIGRARRQIELLREYRTRLIADVVTGKLDVSEAAANLPERDGN